MRQINVVSVVVFSVFAALGGALMWVTGSVAWLIVLVLVGALVALSPRVAQQWERAVVLRLGRFTGLRGPGLFWVIPFIDTVTRFIDQRVITSGFAAEQTQRGMPRRAPRNPRP